MNTKIKEWQAAKKILDRAKKVEMDCRLAVLSDYPIEMGTTSHIKGKVELKITRNVTRTVDLPELVLIRDQLTDLEEACLVSKVTLNANVYKTLPDDSILRKAVTVKPSLPSIKVQDIKND